MDINDKIRLIADGEFEVIAKLSVDETTALCQLVRGLRNSLDWVTQGRDTFIAEREQLMAQDQTPYGYVYSSSVDDHKLHFSHEKPVFSQEDASEYEISTTAVYEGQAVPAQQVAPLKDHQIAETINAVRDVAVEFARTQQLRERIAAMLRPVLRAAQPSPAVAVPDSDEGLLPIHAADHPDCQVMYWSEQELRAIKDYAKRCIAATSPRITEQDAAVKAWEDAIARLSKGRENLHPDDIAVDRFSELMKLKLAKSRDKGRGGWQNPARCKVEDLAEMLIGHLPKGDPVDVANFAMMLCFRDGGHNALSVAGRALLNKLNEKPEIEVLCDECNGHGFLSEWENAARENIINTVCPACHGGKSKPESVGG